MSHAQETRVAGGRNSENAEEGSRENEMGIFLSGRQREGRVWTRGQRLTAGSGRKQWRRKRGVQPVSISPQGSQSGNQPLVKQEEQRWDCRETSRAWEARVRGGRGGLIWKQDYTRERPAFGKAVD